MTAFVVAFVAAIGDFLFGFDLRMIGAANIYLDDQFDLSKKSLGFLMGSAVMGVSWGRSWARGCAMGLAERPP